MGSSFLRMHKSDHSCNRLSSGTENPSTDQLSEDVGRRLSKNSRRLHNNLAPCRYRCHRLALHEIAFDIARLFHRKAFLFFMNSCRKSAKVHGSLSISFLFAFPFLFSSFHIMLFDTFLRLSIPAYDALQDTPVNNAQRCAVFAGFSKNFQRGTSSVVEKALCSLWKCNSLTLCHFDL